MGMFNIGLERNERAGQIAEGGSVKSPAGPEPACSIPRSAIKQLIKH